MSSAAARVARAPAPYANPYLAGVGIGLVLLAAFVVAGRGLGASGAFASAAAAATAVVAPAHARANADFARYLGEGLLGDWLVLEVIGIAAGGLLSAALAGRLRWTTERGPRVSEPTRLLAAVAGGAVMGVGAKFARGCTSGQGLTGGALLSVGSWLFVCGAFAAAYVVAPIVRRQWR